MKEFLQRILPEIMKKIILGTSQWRLSDFQTFIVHLKIFWNDYKMLWKWIHSLTGFQNVDSIIEVIQGRPKGKPKGVDKTHQ